MFSLFSEDILYEYIKLSKKVMRNSKNGRRCRHNTRNDVTIRVLVVFLRFLNNLKNNERHLYQLKRLDIQCIMCTYMFLFAYIHTIPQIF